MSERILTLFGEEIVPEPEKPAGKSRAKKQPKEKIPETPPEQSEPETGPVSDALQQKEDLIEDEHIAAIIKEEPQAADLPQAIAKPEENESEGTVNELKPVIAPISPITEETQPIVIPEEELDNTSAGEHAGNAMPEETPIAEQPQDVVMPDEQVVEKIKKEPKQKKTVDKQPIAEQAGDDDAEEEDITVNKKPVQANLPDDWEGDKQYYSIGEVAALFKVKTSHIRFWTNEFKLKVRTNRKGDRLYTPAQIKELRAIHHLVKERGFTLSGAKAKMKTQNKMDVETIDLKQSLVQLRSKLLTIKNQLK